MMSLYRVDLKTTVFYLNFKLKLLNFENPKRACVYISGTSLISFHCTISLYTCILYTHITQVSLFLFSDTRHLFCTEPAEWHLCTEIKVEPLAPKTCKLTAKSHALGYIFQVWSQWLSKIILALVLLVQGWK